jgi:hypothetical protein
MRIPRPLHLGGDRVVSGAATMHLSGHVIKGASSEQRPKSDKLAEEDMILGSFLQFAERSVDEFARFLLHCGIDNDDINFVGDIPSAILEHYRRPDGTYDLDAVAHDWFRWPPIAARVKELKREKRRQELARKKLKP